MGAWTDLAKAQMFAIAVTRATPITQFEVALYSTSADPGGTPLELTLAGYGRQRTTLVLASSDHASNAFDTVFGPLAAGSYIGMALLDNIGAGRVWFWDDEASSVTIPASSTVTFPAGTLTAVRVP